MIERREFMHGLAAATASTLAAPRLALAQAASSPTAWPTQTVKFVVPFTPGGSTDLLARVIGRQLEPILGQPIVIENRPGAGGSVAAGQVAKADDNHTFMMGHIGTLAFNVGLYALLPYDPVTSFAPVAMVAIVDTMAKVRKDMKFIVNDVLLNLENLKNLFMPVNKHGKNSVTMLQDIDALYASEQATFIYPAGLVSRKNDKGIIEDLQWKKSFITKAKKHKRNIIPVYLDGRNSNFFYNLSRWRTKLGIKANLEMFYLVDEMYQQKNKTITIIFGKPIPYETFDTSKTDLKWAAAVKKEVYELAKLME